MLPLLLLLHPRSQFGWPSASARAIGLRAPPERSLVGRRRPTKINGQDK